MSDKASGNPVRVNMHLRNVAAQLLVEVFHDVRIDLDLLDFDGIRLTGSDLSGKIVDLRNVDSRGQINGAESENGDDDTAYFAEAAEADSLPIEVVRYVMKRRRSIPFKENRLLVDRIIQYVRLGDVEVEGDARHICRAFERNGKAFHAGIKKRGFTPPVRFGNDMNVGQAHLHVKRTVIERHIARHVGTNVHRCNKHVDGRIAGANRWHRYLR